MTSFKKKRQRRWAMATMAVVFTLSAVRLMAGESVRIYPAPAGEPLATNFTVTVGQENVPVYIAKVATIDRTRHASVFVPHDTAFASFDLAGRVQVSVTCPEIIHSAAILPASSGITPVISGHSLVFTVSESGQLELDVNGDWLHSLQLFVNPRETDAPSPNDPNVIYYGPGVHQVEDVVVGSGKTVYIAGGAVIYGKVPPGVNSRTGVTAVSESQGGAIFSLMGDNIKLCGRGIIDGSLCPAHTRNIISVCGTNVSLEGVVVRDASTWTIPIRASEHVTVKNIKIFGWRGNSDGVDICNSRHVRVTHSFLRTMDDLVVIKTPVKGAGESRDITVTGCVLWNELAQALNIGAELRENVEDVHFSDCDIIHDRGREWLLRVYNCDGGDVHDVTFENIRANDAKRLISLWIGTAKWSKDAERGHIENITFKNIQAAGANMSVDLKGWDSQHEIRDVHFQKVLTNGHPLKLGEINRNAFVQDVRVTP
jgi:hypothetical protein